MVPSSPSNQDLIRTLTTASHILHHNNVLDAYGHISVRNSPTTFLLSRNLAPALVSTAADIVEYKIEDASPVKGDKAPKGFSERCIHSEIYKRFPGVRSVVHSHAEGVLPWTISKTPIAAAIHMAGFLGPNSPLFDTSPHYPRTTPPTAQNLLINNPTLGAALASTFSKAGSYSATALSAGASLLSLASKSISSSSDEIPQELQPDHPVVLMRGHGFTCLGGGIEEAVFRAVYTCQNARVMSQALLMRQAHLNQGERGLKEEERVGKVGKDEGVHCLSGAEVEGCGEMGKAVMGRAWALWCREVEVAPLYRNEC